VSAGYDEGMPDRATTQERRRAADRRLGGRLGLGALAAFLVAVPFGLLLVLVESAWEPLEDLDRGTAERLNEVAVGSPLLVDLLDVIAVLFDPWTFRAVVLAVVVLLWRRGARRLAAWAATTTVLGGLLNAVLKLLVQRLRPELDDPVASAGGYSFPSGHAMNSLLCTGVLILVFLPVLSRTGRWTAYVVGLLVVLVTGYDRVALGVHYVSDVVAGWVVGLACLAATAAAFEVWRREEGRPATGPAEGVEPEAADELASLADRPGRDPGDK
jgi:membrane-associated phospholipid phosphatase